MSTLEDRRAALKRRRKLPEMDRRREATQATKDFFIGKPFDWREGRHCVKMAHYHLRQMGKRPERLPKIKGPIEAKRALRERGFEAVSDWFDSFLIRIPPSMMRLGDIAVTPGDEGFESVLIYVAPHKLMGWLPDGSAVVIYDAGFEDLTGAWRV